MGQGRQPLAEEQRTDIATLSRTLQCKLAEHGFTDEPIGGCPLGEESSDVAEVGAIVQNVVAELQRRGLM